MTNSFKSPRLGSVPIRPYIAALRCGNPSPDAGDGERFDELLRRPGCRIERIVSHGQASPPGFWYEQAWDEWVLLSSLELADQTPEVAYVSYNYA